MHIWADDVGQLTDLDVYQDLLTPFGLQMQVTLGEAAGMLRDLASLNNTVLNLYVSFIMAQAGYYHEKLATAETEGTGDTNRFTDTFSDEDWIKHWRLLSKGTGGSWITPFLNRKSEALRLKCISLQLEGQEESSQLGSQFIVWYGTSRALASEFEMEHKQGKATYLIFHPVIARLDKEAFRETKQEMASRCGSDVVLATGELRHKLVREQEPTVVAKRWAILLEKVRSEFEKAWPVVSLSRNAEILRMATEDLKKASAEYSEAQYTNCIRDAAYACESLLLILCQTKGHSFSTDEKPTFDDYLGILKDEIEQDFGPGAMQDLAMIRDTRNKHSHPREHRPSQLEAVRVLRKVELFYEYFQMRGK